MIDDLGRDKVTFARNGFAERAQNSRSVSVSSPTGTPHNRGAGNFLSEEGGEARAAVGEFGLESDLRAVKASLLGVRGADRDVKGSFGVAQGGGEHARGSQVGARAQGPPTQPCSRRTEPQRAPAR